MNTSADRRHSLQVSIIGIGNVLLGDDGFGPLAVEMFRCKYEYGPNVEVLDLGTPGLDLAPYLYGKDLVVLADAVHAEENPGTLCIYHEEDLLSSRAQLRLSAHDPGIWESLAHLRLAGHAPCELIIVGVVPESCDFGAGISASILTTSFLAVDTMAIMLLERCVDCRLRPIRVEPNLWWLPDQEPQFTALS